MEERKLTVCYGCGAFKRLPPQILFQRTWLEQEGFPQEDKINVTCQQGQLAIAKNETRTDSEIQV